MKIGHKLKILRIAKKMEPVVMADRLEISESTYRRYERNESDISITMLHKIALVFGIKATDLLEEDVFLISPRLSSSSEKRIQEYQEQIVTLKQTINELQNIER